VSEIVFQFLVAFHAFSRSQCGSGERGDPPGSFLLDIKYALYWKASEAQMQIDLRSRSVEKDHTPLSNSLSLGNYTECRTSDKLLTSLTERSQPDTLIPSETHESTIKLLSTSDSHEMKNSCQWNIDPNFTYWITPVRTKSYNKIS